MRILFLSNLYPPNVVGGYERLCFEMAGALAARGHDIAVLTSDYGGEIGDYPNQQIHRQWQLLVGKNAIYEPYAGSAGEKQAIVAHNVACLERQVKDFAPEVLFVWNLFFLDATLLQAIRQQGLPTVFLLTDNWMIAFLNSGFWSRYFAEEVLSGARTWLQGLRFYAASLLSRRSDDRLRLAANAIFASRFMQDLYRKAGFGFSDSTVIYHGIPAAPAAPGIARDRFCAPDELRLLFAGRVVEIKGVHTAIDALPRIAARLPGRRIRLTVLGDRSDEPYLQRLQARIRHLGIGDQVRFEAAVAESDLPAVFAGHDIYLFPSLYEPFSLTLIHALRSGIPTVASDAGGNVEIVIDGETGKVFRRGDARSLADQVLHLARDDSLRATVAEGGRRAAADYTFSRMVGQVERCLEGWK